jgi:hypothetical protein
MAAREILLDRLDEILRRQQRLEERIRQLEWRVDCVARDVDAIDRRLRPHGDGRPSPIRRARRVS